ncbi:hypothetical protein [Paenibacillus sabinae]|uniref:Uncharacterized protein n=1 Tax=Paenibacillus sabinae T27 TaxID=1268072 RepID=X4ZTQ6_9BACL|nr:hypothetical protein [Paenibacillus sabinae]AHV95748.1 hypothetical protein PSAB_04060 [Paenibacillus sabinae T27]
MKRSVRSAALRMLLGFSWFSYAWIAQFTDITKPYFVVFLTAVLAAIIMMKTRAREEGEFSSGRKRWVYGLYAQQIILITSSYFILKSFEYEHIFPSILSMSVGVFFMTLAGSSGDISAYALGFALVLIGVTGSFLSVETQWNVEMSAGTVLFLTGIVQLIWTKKLTG